MARRTDFRKAGTYTGQKIKGPVVVSWKIDGVRILEREGKFVTRNDKVPPGLDIALTEDAKEKIRKYKDCEVFMGDFFSSISPLSKHNPDRDCIDACDVYPLVELDDRLYICTLNFIDKNDEEIQHMLKQAIMKGYEGLVLRNDTHWYRVKPQATADVYITGYFEQLDNDKNPKGILGGFNTNWGKVTAFKQKMREKLWVEPEQYIGQLISVQYKERYHTGNFRYAVKFLNFRTDKDEESFDTEPPLK